MRCLIRKHKLRWKFVINSDIDISSFKGLHEGQFSVRGMFVHKSGHTFLVFKACQHCKFVVARDSLNFRGMLLIGLNLGYKRGGCL